MEAYARKDRMLSRSPPRRRVAEAGLQRIEAESEQLRLGSLRARLASKRKQFYVDTRDSRDSGRPGEGPGATSAGALKSKLGRCLHHGAQAAGAGVEGRGG